MKRRVGVFLIIPCLLLVGCANQQELKFYNKNLLSLESEKTLFTIDHGYCTQVSYGAVQMPDVRVYIPPSSTSGQSAVTTGTFNAIDLSTGRLSTGNVTMHTQTTPRYDIAGSIDRGIATASAMAALAAQTRAARARQDIYCGCMARLGWTEGKKPSSLLADQLSTDGFKVIGDDPNLALSLATEALSVAPNHFYSLYLDGMAKETLNDDDNAILSLQRAVAAQQDSKVIAYIGYIYLYKKKDPNTAITYLVKAKDVDPANANTYFALSEAYARVGDIEKTKETYHRLKELNPDLASKFVDKLKKSISK